MAASEDVQMPVVSVPEQAILTADSKLWYIMTSMPFAQFDLYVTFPCMVLGILPTLLGSLSVGRTYNETSETVFFWPAVVLHCQDFDTPQLSTFSLYG